MSIIRISPFPQKISILSTSFSLSESDRFLKEQFDNTTSNLKLINSSILSNDINKDLSSDLSIENRNISILDSEIVKNIKNMSYDISGILSINNITFNNNVVFNNDVILPKSISCNSCEITNENNQRIVNESMLFNYNTKNKFAINSRLCYGDIFADDTESYLSSYVDCPANKYIYVFYKSKYLGLLSDKLNSNIYMSRYITINNNTLFNDEYLYGTGTKTLMGYCVSFSFYSGNSEVILNCDKYSVFRVYICTPIDINN